MATYDKSTGNAGKLRLEITFTQNKAANTTTFTVKRTILCTDPYTNVGSMPWTGSDAGTSRSGSVALPAGFGSRTVGTWTVTKSHASDGVLSSGSRTFTFNIPASGTSGLGGATSHSVTVSVPRIVQSPDAPSIGTPVRVSDTQHTVAWTRDASAIAPYTSQQVQRRTYSGSWGSWTGVATLGTDYSTSGSQSWSDTGTVANRAYQYRVKASNGSGEATSGSSSTVFTTPGAPSSVVAAKTALGGVALTVAHSAAVTSVDTEIEYSTDGGSSWSDLDEVSGAATTYTWASPPTGDPLMFRVRVHVDSSGSVGNGLVSGWRTSNTVQLTAPPNAPSALTPNGVVFDGIDARAFTWQHNPADSSPQSEFQLRHRAVGDSWTEETAVDSVASLFEFPAETFTNGGQFEWAVRTWGVHDDPSPWSATATFTTSTTPVVSITSPEAVFETSLLTVAWTFYDAEVTDQGEWQAQLLRDSVTVEARSGAGAAVTTTFATVLSDATEYAVRVRGRDGDGLWSAWDQVTFDTLFELPPAPVIGVAWEPNEGAVNITIENPPASLGTLTSESLMTSEFLVTSVAALAIADHNAVYRSSDMVTWILLDDNVPLDSTYTDRTVPFGVESFYKVVSWSDLPSAADSSIASITPESADVYWSAGEGFGSVLRVRAGLNGPPRVDLSGGLRERVLHYFAGRTLPVEAAGTQRSRGGSVSFATLTLDDRDVAREMSVIPAPHLIRTPDGTTLFCSIGPVDEARVIDGVYQMGFAVSEVEQ